MLRVEALSEYYYYVFQFALFYSNEKSLFDFNISSYFTLAITSKKAMTSKDN